MADTANEVITLSGVVVVVLVNYLREHQAWGWMRLVQGPSSMKEAPGLVFAKVMGSGHGGGFSIRPSASHQGLIVMFDHAEGESCPRVPVERVFEKRLTGEFRPIDQHGQRIVEGARLGDRLVAPHLLLRQGKRDSGALDISALLYRHVILSAELALVEGNLLPP